MRVLVNQCGNWLLHCSLNVSTMSASSSSTGSQIDILLSMSTYSWALVTEDRCSGRLGTFMWGFHFRLDKRNKKVHLFGSVLNGSHCHRALVKKEWLAFKRDGADICYRIFYFLVFFRWNNLMLLITLWSVVWMMDLEFGGKNSWLKFERNIQRIRSASERFS